MSLVLHKLLTKMCRLKCITEYNIVSIIHSIVYKQGSPTLNRNYMSHQTCLAEFMFIIIYQ